MREFKIFIVLLVFTAVVYWGVEPYAHSQMHEHTPAASFDFKSLDISEAERKLAKAKAEQNKDDEAHFAEVLAATKKLYENVDAISALSGDAEAGKGDFEANCAGCHRAAAAGFTDADDGISGQGIIIPDLSTAGALYDEKFLAAIMIDPALAMKNNKKFNAENPHPMMLSIADEGNLDDEGKQTIANINAFLKQIGAAALKADQAAAAKDILESKLSDEEKAAAVEKSNQRVVFEHACGRCHDVKYDELIAKVNGGDLIEYMGSTPPDLSIIIRAKGAGYLAKFINDTQKQLPGTAMPRVGLNEQAQEQVISYLEKVGDSKKAERESHGIYIMAFFVLLALLAYGWKSAVWRDLH